MFSINVKAISGGISVGTGEWAGSKRGLCPQPQLCVDCLTSSHPAPLLAASVQPQELAQRASVQLWKGRREAGEMQDVQQPCTSYMAVK